MHPVIMKLLVLNLSFILILQSGILTNYLPVQQKCSSSNDVQQNPALSKRMLGGNSSSTYTSAGKSNSVVTRTLLNVS